LHQTNEAQSEHRHYPRTRDLIRDVARSSTIGHARALELLPHPILLALAVTVVVRRKAEPSLEQVGEETRGDVLEFANGFVKLQKVEQNPVGCREV
jgi:hypothetical protein